jgi:hypothetical protein
MAKGPAAQAILDLTPWKDTGNALGGLLSKQVRYFPETARWFDISLMPYKPGVLFCLAKVDFQADEIEGSAINYARFLMTTSAVWASSGAEHYSTTTDTRTKLS